MELCGVCEESVSKYRCPACTVRTCSVNCVKEHKKRSKCTGKRCKTAFVSLSEFTDSQLFSDYYFLEDVGRHGDSSRRDRIYREKQLTENRSQRHNFHWLKNRAAERGLTLLLQPPGMSLHKMNTSRTVSGRHKGKWVIEWRIHLVFPLCGIDYQEKHVPESMVVHELLRKYLHPTDSDPIAKHRLRLYIDRGGVDEVMVLMRDDQSSSQGTRYHVLDKDKTICDNLKNKTIIEFPTLIVVLTSELSHYSLVGLENGTSTDSSSHQRVGQPTSEDSSSHQRVGQTTSETLKDEQCSVEERHTTSERRNSSDWSDDEHQCNSLQLIARMYSN